MQDVWSLLKFLVETRLISEDDLAAEILDGLRRAAGE
jgi:hypothetical protein